MLKIHLQIHIRIDEGIFVGQNNWYQLTDTFALMQESQQTTTIIYYIVIGNNGELIEGQYIDLIFSDEAYILI